MDADSSYGGSDTTQDSNVGLHEHHSINEKSNGTEDNPQHGNITTAVHVISLVGGSNEETPDNTYYHKNEITLPVNGNGDDQTDFQNSNNSKLPHYLATANLNINESLEHHSNLEEMNRNYKSSHKLSPESSQLHSSGPNGIDNPAFVEDNRSTFHNDKKPYKNELDVNSLTSNDEYLTEAVNLELINLKPSSGIHNGIKEPCESNNSKNLTSIPIKKDDDDGRSPYDEYFVPVNEHRKYIRGEKLYLTRDSRAEKTKSKCICWTIVICIVATAVILGILAAVGALGNQGQLPQPVEVTGRNFQNDNDIVKAGINAPTFSSSSQSSEPPVDTFIDSPTDPPTDFPTNHSTDPPSNPLTDPSSNPITDPPTDPPTNKPDDLYHPFSHHPALWPVESAPSSTETSTNLPSSSSPVSVTPDPFVAIIGSSDAPSTNSSVNEVTNSSVSEITDSSVSEVSSSEASLRFVEPISPVGAEEDTATVPNVLDLDLTIDNMDYKIDLSDPESSEYKALSSSVEQLLKENVLDQIAPLDDKSSDIQIRVFEFSPGSVIVRTRISWNRDSNAPLSGINETLIQEKIKEFLRTNTGLLGNYHIDQNKMAFRKIPDACLETNNGCEHLCLFDYNHLNFTCTCPDNKKLMRDQKHCELNDAVEKLQEQWMNPGDKAAIPEYRNFYQHGESDKYSEYTQEKPESTTVPLNNSSEVLQNHTEPTPVPEPEPEPSTEPEIFQRPPSSSEERSFKQILSQPAILNDESFTMMNPVNSESESSAEDDQDKVLEMISGTLLDPTTDSSEIVHNNDAREDKSPEITKQDFYYDVLREQLNRYEQLNADKERTTKPNNEYGLGRVFTPIAEVFTPAPVSTTQLSDVYTARPTPKPELHYHTEKTQMQMETSMESEPMVHDEHMSPFLPDIDNDTFVNSLHSEEHLTDHNFEIHENTSVPVPVPVTKPPSLEFDQINRTNPFDNFTSDSMEHFNVKPEVVIIIDDKDDNVKTESPTTTEESTTLEITTEDIALNKNEVTPLNNTQLFNNFNDTHITEIISTTNENDNDGTTENIMDITNSLDNENNSIENIKDVTETIQNTTEMIHITEKIQNDTNSLQQGMIILEENIQNITDNIMQNITENIQNTTTENIQNTTDNIMQNVTENIQNTTTENIQNTTDNIMQNVTENMQNTTTENIQITTENIQNATTGNIQNKTENIQNITETINTVTDRTYPDIISKIENDSTITDNLKIEGLNAETTTMILPEQLSTTIPDGQNILTELTNIETTTETEHSTNSSNINTNFKDITTSTEDLIALETTTNTDGNSSNEILDNEIKGSNVTEIQADILETLRTSVNVTKDNVTEETSTTLDPQQYEVKESTDDLTTTEKLFVTHRPSTEKPEVQENGFELKPNTEEPKQLQDEPEEDLSIEPLETDTTEENNRINFESNEIDNDIFAIKNNSVEKPVTEDFVLPKVSRCNPGQFQCLNGTSVKDGSYCIDIGDRCDSIFDCSDGSDETNCVKQGCPNNFKCAGNQCLKRHLVCDGIQNCNDGSDEINCGNWTCNSDEFSCGPSNRCISLKWKCDSRQNCPDGSDENDCIRLGPCPDNFFKCTEDTNCLPVSWKCDGHRDCSNSEDEDEEMCSCNKEQFKCKMGGGCIPKERVCDGIAQCADKSDEWDCLKLDHIVQATAENSDKKILQIQAENNTWLPICMDWTLWNTTYADLVCQNLGYSASSALESVPKSQDHTSKTSYVLNVIPQQENILHFEPSKISNCDQFVSISCQEYVCGSPSPLEISSARIVGGEKAAPTQWPSLALLYNKKNNIYCTSTLITPLWAVTSYSCIGGQPPMINADDWSLYAGGTHKGDNFTSQVRKLREIVTHPQTKFSSFGFTNDAVLLKLQKPINVNLNVSAVCLPKDEIVPRQLCIVAGWGINKPGEPSMQQYLHYLPVPLIDTHECNSTKHYNGKISSDKICAGYTDAEKSPCFDDEGAPLMCFSDKTATWELHGLLSHHGDCGSNKHPAVYTVISTKLKSWMTSTIGKQALSSL